MVNSAKLIIKQCFKCSSGIQMPDGNVWCEVTMKSENGIGCSYVPGLPKLYKLIPKVVQKEKVVTKIAGSIPKAKPAPVKQKPIVSSKKTTSPQIKLF